MTRAAPRPLLAAALALLLGLAGPAAWAAADTAPRPADPGATAWRPATALAAEEPGRVALLAQAEAALASGKAVAAVQLLQQAALIRHAADTEAALVRAQLQAGDYRQALGFAAHAAGAHRELPASTALYLWLLHLGGQPQVARHLLAQAQARQPDEPALQALAPALANAGAQPHWLRPPAALLQGPARLQPAATGAALTPDARGQGSAMLLADGRHALLPAAQLPADAQAQLWLRNGLGQTMAAHVLRQDAASGLALLRLDAALPTDPGLRTAPRLPFAGSPGLLMGHGEPGDAQPLWPQMLSGFIGRAADAGPQALGIAVPAGALGGPVFDAAGRLLGLASAGPQGAVLMPVAGWAVLAEPRLLPPADLTAATAPGVAGMMVDQIYEAGLRTALQLLVSDTR